MNEEIFGTPDHQPEGEGTAPNPSEAVSYTHLDVYKRQDVSSSAEDASGAPPPRPLPPLKRWTKLLCFGAGNPVIFRES